LSRVTSSTVPVHPSPPGLTLAVEDNRRGAWWMRCAKTLGQVMRHPQQSFAVSPEPVNHGKVLRFLATLRFPLWVALVTWLVIRDFGLHDTQAIPHRAIHSLLEAPLVIALSTWLLIMVPVGLPLLYFTVGMLAHIGIGLTGGAPRSLGATMRALGYALAPALLAV